MGWLVERFWLRLNFAIAFVAICTGGIGIIYLIGIPWNAAVSHLPVGVVALGSTPFLIGDIIKATIAAGVTLSVRRSYPLSALSPEYRYLAGIMNNTRKTGYV